MMKIIKNRKILFIIPILIFLSGVFILISSMPLFADDEIPGNTNEEILLLASLQENTIIEQSFVTAPSQAERIMKALSEAYPGRIGTAEFRDGDWAFLIGRTWFYYAEGRLLPEHLKHRVSEYRAMGFNSNYQVDLVPWENGEEQRAVRTRNYYENLNRPPQPPPVNQTPRQPSPRRSNYFFEALWGGSTREESYTQQAVIVFLGRSLTIHSGLAEIMRQIEIIIREEAGRSTEVRQWINSLGSISGWNWRNVASSGNRSFHSYGIAIDILPANLNGLATYWMWTSEHNPLWWNVPYTGRWHPPDFVVKTFESFGFTWGGKWGNFDTMHFEYRPEAFILSGIPLRESR